jgi:phage regulator Rha-like protein
MAIQDLVRVETRFHQVIELLQVDSEFRIDSRQVAPGIGIEHESFLKTLETYRTELEHWGFFRFQIGKTTADEQGRGRPSKYVMLNRNQVLFAITLSRNTPQVVRWKMALIDALDQLDNARQTKETRAIRVTRRRLLLPAEKDQYIFHVVDLLGAANGRDVQRYCRWYAGREARQRMTELAEQGELVACIQGKTTRYCRRDEISDEKGLRIVETPGGQQSMNCVNE